MFDRIRNAIYNKSDVFFALIIICAVAAVIFWRIGIIMEYPEKIIAGESLPTTESQEQTSDSESDLEDTEGQTDPIIPEDTTAGNPAEVIYHAIYIAPEDTPQTVASMLTESGLLSNEGELLSAFQAAGNPALIPGDYTIPSNADKNSIVNIITGNTQ